MDGVLRTFILTLATELAFLCVNVGQVGIYCDRFELADLHALLASDTAYAACFACLCALVLVVTEHYDATVLQALQTNFYHATRTSLGASTAGSTFLFVHLRKSRFGIHADGIELTSCYTVATAQTAIGTGCLART